MTELNLPEARQSRGVSLEAIANTTRISMRFLEAIEAEEFEKLPGGVFAINYVKQYARCIGFDEAQLVERCRRCLRAEPEIQELAPLIEAAAPEKPRSRLLFRLPVVRIRITWTPSMRRRTRSAAARA